MKKVTNVLREIFFWVSWAVWGIALLTVTFFAGHLWGVEALTALEAILR